MPGELLMTVSPGKGVASYMHNGWVSTTAAGLEGMRQNYLPEQRAKYYINNVCACRRWVHPREQFCV